MRRSLLLVLLVSLPITGCAAVDKSYRDFAAEPTPALAGGAASAEAPGLITAFYGKESADLAAALPAALARAPRHGGLREIAAYQALLEGDAHAAFTHFVHAAADRDAVAPELSLWEMRDLEDTVTERLTAIDLYRTLAAQHPSASVRDLATYYLAQDLRLLARYDEARAASAQLGFIDAWSILGAFDNDQGKGFSTAYAPELPGDPRGEYQGARLPIRWRASDDAPMQGVLSLGNSIWPAESAVAYAETFVTSPRNREVLLALSTSNDVRAWIDGRLVLSDEKVFHDDLDNVVARVTLKAGTSRLLIKSAHGTGGWRLGARFTEIDGKRPLDLTFARSAPAAAPAHAGIATKPGEPAPKLFSGAASARIAAIPDANRRLFLLGRLASKIGHTRKTPLYFQPLLEAAPKNPAAMYYAAVSQWDTGEAGKALDLLNVGVAAFPRLAAFPIQRARFYKQRRLFDKAQKDLEAAIRVSPRSRDAYFELSHVQAARGWPIDRCAAMSRELALWPDTPDALVERSQCKGDQGLARDAELDARRAVALLPGDTAGLARVARLAQNRLDDDDALTALRALRTTVPAAVDYLFDEADLQRRAGHDDEARRLFELARDASPDSPRAYAAMASMAYASNHIPEATRLYRLALERDPDDSTLTERVAALAPEAPALGERLAPTSDDIDKAVRSAERVTVHPGSHYVVLLDDEVTTVNADGSSRRIVTFVAQAITTEGRDALIQARLPGSGKVRMIESYAVRKDGERQEVSSLTGGMVRYRNLDVGSIVVRQYVHYAPPPSFLPNEYASTRFSFQQMNAQVEKARWCLILGKERTLNLRKRGEVETKHETLDDKQVWSFSSHGAAPLLPEIDMPPAQDALFMAAVSTVQSWDSYVRWENALLGDAFPPSESLDRLAKKITLGAATPREKIDRLWAYVAQEIRYQQEYEDTIAGVKPHQASVVVERGYGDCKDKSVLLIRLARAVGVDLRFALLRTTPAGEVLREIPNQQFNHAITYAPKQEGIAEGFFLDTTTNGLDIGNLRSDDQGATSLVIDPKTGTFEMLPIPYQDPELERVTHTIAVDLSDPAKAHARDQLEVRGDAASRLRRTLRSGESAKKAYQAISESLFAATTLLSGTTEHDQDLTRPLAVTLDIDLASAVQADGARSRLDLPFLFPLGGEATLATRKLPLLLPRGTRTVAITAELPEGQEVLHAPGDLDVKHPCFSMRRTTVAAGRKVTITTELRSSCARVAMDEYPAFRAAVQKAVVQSRENLVYGPKEAEKPKAKAKGGK
ncbi:MAG: transglutaminase domain-containing protein [Byssovorax sp.]